MFIVKRIKKVKQGDLVCKSYSRLTIKNNGSDLVFTDNEKKFERGDFFCLDEYKSIELNIKGMSNLYFKAVHIDEDLDLSFILEKE